MRSYKIDLVVLTLLATILRLWNLGRQSFWLDEAYTVWDSLPGWTELHRHISASPPFFYYLVKVIYSWTGVNDFGLRLLPALFGIATIPAFYWMLFKRFNRATALWGAFLLALSPFHIMYSQELRMFTLSTLEVLSALYFFERAMEQNEKRDWTIFSLLCMAGFYTHYWFVFFIASFFIVFVSKAILQRRLNGRAILPFLAIVAACLPWLPVVIAQSSTPATQHMRPTTIRTFFETGSALSGLHMTLGAVSLSVPSNVLLPLTAMPLSLMAIGLGWVRPQRGRVLFHFLAGCGLPLTLAWMESHWFKPVYFPSRYTLLALPCFLVPIAHVLSFGTKRMRVLLYTVMIVWVTGCLALLPNYYTRFDKADWKTMAKEIQDDYHPGDAAWLGAMSYGWVTMWYYLPNQIPRIDNLLSGTPQPKRVFIPDYGYSGNPDAFSLGPQLSARWRVAQVKRYLRSSLIVLEAKT